MSFIGLGVALSVVFGCLLLALVFELCYLLLWKKRGTRTGIEIDQSNNEVVKVKGGIYGVCWNAPTTNNQSVVVGTEQENKGHEQDLELGIDKDVLLKTFGDEGVEAELMRLHNLAGPPRFLFTIKEETKEDLESEDGKSRGDNRSRKGSRTRSLSDIMVGIDTPFLNNPMASSSPMSRCGLDNLESYKNQGFNPLFESSSVESELNRFRSSPPPKFKFLRDAEEKLYRRLMEEAQRKAQKNQGVVSKTEDKDCSLNSTMDTEDEDKDKDKDKDKSFLRIINNNDNREQNQQIEVQQQPHFPSSSSQVLPLASSPTTLRPVDKASMIH